MSRLVIRSFAVSADGYGAGPRQTLEAPMGERGDRLHGWARATLTFRRMFGQEGGSDGVDERFAAMGFDSIGAWVLGRNMFGPVRGPWADESWRGWWGERPPYACDVFVLTHHPRAPLAMEGGTTFHFWTGGLASAVEAAREAAGGRDIRLGGGVATLREGFAEGLVDHAHIAVAGDLLGAGEALWAGLDLPTLGYRVERATPGEGALHLEIGRA
jgi:dihydrofolate reductase